MSPIAQAIESYLDHHPGYLEQLAYAPLLSPRQAPPVRFVTPEEVFDDPPERIALPDHGKPWSMRKRSRLDFAEREAANHLLGALGEEFVVELERCRLRLLGRDDLARKVEWVSRTVGDGLGFDVLSFDEGDGSDRLLEVKTTGLGKFSPFRVTANEVRCSEDMAKQYQLYRVFDFGRSPRVYVLSGSLRATCRLEPVQFLAAI